MWPSRHKPKLLILHGSTSTNTARILIHLYTNAPTWKNVLAISQAWLCWKFSMLKAAMPTHHNSSESFHTHTHTHTHTNTHTHTRTHTHTLSLFHYTIWMRIRRQRLTISHGVNIKEMLRDTYRISHEPSHLTTILRLAYADVCCWHTLTYARVHWPHHHLTSYQVFTSLPSYVIFAYKSSFLADSIPFLPTSHAAYICVISHYPNIHACLLLRHNEQLHAAISVSSYCYICVLIYI